MGIGDIAPAASLIERHALCSRVSNGREYANLAESVIKGER